AYYEPETGRMTSLEYDGNSTFVNNAATSANWGPFKNASNVNYPLLNKLLNIPEWRQRYLAHYRTILSETFTTTNANALVDEMHNQISGLVAADSKKLYTTAQYTTEYNALKVFVNNRRNYLLSNAEVAQVGPVITSAKFYNANLQEYIEPVADEVANIKAVVTSTSGISAVYLYYASGIVGNFTKIQMFDDGTHSDDAANDGVFGAQIPGQIAGTFMRYYVEAIANNTARSASYLPAGAEHDIFVYRVQQVLGSNGVVINEIMAQNNSTITDEAGDYEDWIELYNNNNFPVDLSGYYLTDTVAALAKWQIPAGTVIPANDYLIIWADNEALDGPLHASFKLAAEGESVILSNPNLLLVDQINYSLQTVDMGLARVPNGTGSFVIQEPTWNSNNESSMATIDFEVDNNEFAIYPNPASTYFNLSFGLNLVGKNIQIFNSLGQSISEMKAASQMEIVTSNYPAGVYFVKCGNITKKVVID
ncbi:MAG: lamin tail domain-containing protein, partial [Bacteroidota bacterium]